MSNSRKIVVADDEPVVRQLLAQSLGTRGFDVLLAENGKEAFELVQKNKVDLVLSDINMPGSGGIELMEMIRRSDHKDMPVVLMTGDADAFEKSKAEGATILRKPFRRQELVELINSILDPSKKPA
jgi:CheY-like chemotaxis protein